MAANEHILEGEILPPEPDEQVTEAPKRGTLAWLLEQPTVLRDGVSVPECNRIPEGAEVKPEAGACSVVRADGERCRGKALRAFGLCIGHAGGGGMTDPEGMRRKASERHRTLRMTRQLLAIGPSQRLEPRAAARIRAAVRAQDLAQAIVDGPLDDPDLKPIERQQAALRAVDATFPLSTVTAELSLTDAEGMDWKSMQSMALSLLG